jgi:hypothetical protein
VCERRGGCQLMAEFGLKWLKRETGIAMGCGCDIGVLVAVYFQCVWWVCGCGWSVSAHVA